MNPDEFRDRVLGRWSSHPHWVQWRRKGFLLASFVPLLAVLLVGVLAAGHYENWRSLVQHGPKWLVALAAALAFGVGAAVTAALCARLAQWRAPRHLKLLGDSSSLPIEPWVPLLALLLGAVGPWLLAHWSPLPPMVRFLFQLFAFLPLVGLLLAMRVLEEPASDGQEAGQADWQPSPYETRRRPLWLVLLVLTLGLWAITLVHDMGVAVGHSGLHRWAAGWIPWYAELNRLLLGSALLVPLAFVLFALWQLWPAVVPVSGVQAGPQEGDPAEEQPTLWARLGHWLRALFPASRPAGPPGEPVPPQWLDELLATVGNHAEQVQRIQLGADEVSPDSPRTDLKHIFGVPAPTMDQVELLERFEQLYRQLIEGEGTGGPRAAELCADLLVQGNPGSGKTTGLLACAAYAALVRGQRVLFLVPDALRQEALQQRITELLRALRLNYYIQAGVLHDEAVDRWVTGADPVPHILIGTAESVEEHFYGHACARDQLGRLRRLVLLPEVLIVDDLLDFDDAQRCHLPFLLDKHRLLLAAEYLPLQVVVSCRRLGELGEEILAQRLFTVKYLDKNRNVLSLKPRQGARAWRVRLQADDVSQTMETLVVWCLGRGLDVVLYRAGIDEEQRKRLQQRLAARGGNGRLAVLADLERPLSAPSPLEVGAIFYEEALHDDICLALRMHAGHDETVIFRVAPREAVKEKVSGIVPVVAHRSATPLLVAHLKSIGRFLKPLTPIPADTWGKFGVEYRTAPLLPPDMTTADAWLEVDLWDEPDSTLHLEPYLALGQPVQTREPVHVFGLPDPNWSVYGRWSGDRLLLGRPRSPEDSQRERARRARWLDEQADFGEIGQVDLAHAYKLKLVWGRRSIGLRTIRQESDGLISLVSQIWQGSGSDRYLPIYDLAWTLPAGQKGERFWGGTDDGLRWFELDGATHPVAMEARIVGHMSEYAEMTEIPAIRFQYPARFCGLLFGPQRLDEEQLAETIGAGLQGDWAVGGDTRFWPALTGALNYAVRVKVPGLHYFTRIVAFQLTGDAARLGAAVAWFVEPLSGGRTASRLMGDLLRHRRHRDRLFQSAQWLLEQFGETTLPPAHFLRRHTHLGFQADDQPPRLEQALPLIAELRSPSQSAF